MIQEEVNRLLLGCGDFETLAERILLLADDTELRQKLGEEGRRRGIEKFDHRNNTAIVLERYGLNTNMQLAHS